MAKAKKIEVKNVILNENQDNTLVIQGIEGEETPFNNLSDEIRELLKEGNKVNIKISKARKSSGSSNKKPIYKYACPNCGKKIKTNEKDLHIQCVECEVNYEIVEDKEK